MRKISNLITGALSMLAIFCTPAAFAAEIGDDLTNDLGSITIGETGTLAQKGDYYTFIPETSGVITIKTDYDHNTSIALDWNNFSNFFYKQSRDPGVENAFLNQISIAKEKTDEGWEFVFDVTGGAKYVVGYGNDLSVGFSFVITEGAQKSDLNLVEVNPMPGGIFDPNLNIDLSLIFDEVPTFTTAALVFTDKEGNEQEININAYTYPESGQNKLTLRIANGKNSPYYAAKMVADTEKPFQVIVSGLSSGVVNFVGVDEALQDVEGIVYDHDSLSLTYDFALDFELVSAEWPEVFMGYWAPGSEGSLATLTFNLDIARVDNVTAIFGYHNPENIPRKGARVGEDPDPSWVIDNINIDGNKVVIDFAGINYEEERDYNYTSMTILVNGIIATNGQIYANDGMTTIFTSVAYQPLSSDEPEMTIGDATATPILGEEGVTGVAVSWGDYDLEIVNKKGSITISSNTPDVAAPGISMIEVEANVLTVIFDAPITSEGMFTVSIPKGYVAVGNEGYVNASQDIEFSTPEAGIESIFAGNEALTIHNLQGVRINAASISELPAGIYVINGRKVAVK